MGVMRIFSVVAAVGIAASGWAADNVVPLFGAGGNGGRSAGLVINQQAVVQLRSDAEELNLGAIPMITGDTAQFELTPMPVFPDDAQINLVKADGTSTTISPPDIRTWYGRDAENPDRALFISAAADGTVQAMISGDSHTSVTVISRSRSGGPDEYRIEPAKLPPHDFCKTEVVPADAQAPRAAGPRAGINNVTLQLDLLIDVGYKLYAGPLNEDTGAALNYLTNLMGVANSVMRRDLNLHFSLKHVYIWTERDPLTVLNDEGMANTGQQLNAYRRYLLNNRATVDFDLAHLLDNYMEAGGRAYLNALESYRREIRCAVSNVEGIGEFPEDSSYYWDSMVFTHEIGHNLGSPHTHCYSPPIDCCVMDRGCPECTFEKPTNGTIMSYCHLQLGNGGAVDMRFHERCVTVMRTLTEQSLLASPFRPQPDIEVRGSDGIIIPPNSIETKRSTLLRSSAVGSAVEETYLIRNAGAEALNLTGNPRVQLLNLDFKPLVASDFSVKTQPSAAQVAAGGSSEFTIQYQPKTDAEQWAIVHVASNDPDQNSYMFLVKGRLLKPSDPYIGTSSGPVVIPEQGNAWTKVPVLVEDVPGDVVEVQVRFNGTDCTVDNLTGIEHPYVGDLIILLESPSGTLMTLAENIGATTITEPGAGGRNFCHTLLTDAGESSIQEVSAMDAPYSGPYTAKDSFAIFNGEQPNGVWRLWFYDRAKPDQGTVHSVSVMVRGDSLAAREPGPPLSSDAKNWSLFK